MKRTVVVLKLTINCRDIRSKHRRDEDVTANQPLPVDSEELRLVREFVPQSANRRCAELGCISEQSVLQKTRSAKSVDARIIEVRTQYGNIAYRTAIAVLDAFATLSQRYGSWLSAPCSLWLR